MKKLNNVMEDRWWIMQSICTADGVMNFGEFVKDSDLVSYMTNLTGEELTSVLEYIKTDRDLTCRIRELKIMEHLDGS